MQDDLLQVVKRRREEVNRRIGELRAELKVLEARADELERIWKEVVAGQNPSFKSGVVYISEPRIATANPTGAAALILAALKELEDAGYEGAERAVILKIIRREDPKVKPNTIRVAFKRLLDSNRVERHGNLFSLPSNS